MAGSIALRALTPVVCPAPMAGLGEGAVWGVFLVGGIIGAVIDDIVLAYEPMTLPARWRPRFSRTRRSPG